MVKEFITYDTETGHIAEDAETRISAIGGSAITVQDEGVDLATAATTLNFTGTGVTASGTGGTKTINVSGGGSAITVQDEGTDLTTAATVLNFVGSGVTATGNTGTKTITVSSGSAITVQEEGTPLTTAATTLNFVGSGVTASGTGATKTITVSDATLAETVTVVSPAGATLTLAATTDHEITLGNDLVITPRSDLVTGKRYSILIWISQPTTGGTYDYTVDYDADITWLGDNTQPVMPTGAGSLMAVTLFTRDGGATYRGSSSIPDPPHQGVLLVPDADGNCAVDARLGDVFYANVDRDLFIQSPTHLTPWKPLLFCFMHDSAGGHAIDWDTIYGWSTTVPELVPSSSGNRTDYVGGIYNPVKVKFHPFGADVSH